MSGHLRRNFWGTPHQQFPTLNEPLHARYVIVGAGIVGLTTAYFLQQAGCVDIALIEQSTIAAGSTGHSAGMLVMEPEHALWPTLVDGLGVYKSAKYLQAQAHARDIVKYIIAVNKIECGYNLADVLILGNHTDEFLEDEYQARYAIGQHPDGVGQLGMRREFATPLHDSALRLSDNIGLNPLEFAHELARLLISRGVRIYEHTPATHIHQNTVHTDRTKITADTIIQAGNNLHHAPVNHYLTTIGVTERLTPNMLRSVGLMDRDMFITNGVRSYYYGRVTHDNRLLIGYGDVLEHHPLTHHEPHQPHISRIRYFAHKLFPTLNLKLEYGWSATYALSAGLLPYIHQGKNHWIIAGGGTQLSSIAAASYVVDTILGRPNVASELFGATPKSNQKD